MDNGATFPLHPIDDSDRKLDIDFHFSRVNHKSTLKHTDVIHRLISEDVTRGFALPLPTSILHKIPNASLAPLGCVEQETIDSHRKKVPKFCMTHDQSFPGPSGLSVNLRVIKDQLPPIMYSYVLSRSIHYINNLRYRYPQMKIYLCKVDLDSAYRRCHLSSTTTQESLTSFNNLIYMALQMTFGGAPCPSMWGYISDTLADVCNSLIQNDYWNHHTLVVPLSRNIEPPLDLPDSIPFHPAKPLSIQIPHNDRGKVDIYIDDTIGIAPDIDDNVDRVSKSIPLAIHSLARPLDSLDAIPRNDIISLKNYRPRDEWRKPKSS